MQVSKDHFVSEKAFAEYERGIDWFFSELVHLNTTVYLMEKIINFPFSLFGSSNELFFYMVMENFQDAVILIATKLYTDQGGGKLTLRRFKNRLKELVKIEYHQELFQDLRFAKLDKTTEDLLEKIKARRNARIAHLAEDFVRGNTKLDPIRMVMLTEIRDKFNELFCVLTLKDHVDFRLLPIDYDATVQHPKGSDPRADIERILDSVARDSYLLNLPEQNPTSWHFRRERLSAEDLGTINLYRRKFGLSEV